MLQRLEVEERWMQDWKGGGSQVALAVSWWSPLLCSPWGTSSPELAISPRAGWGSLWLGFGMGSRAGVTWGHPLAHITLPEFPLGHTYAFSSREIEMLSIASLAGEKKPGEWAPESGQAVYEGTEIKI